MNLLLPYPATLERWTVTASLLEFAFLSFPPLGSYTKAKQGADPAIGLLGESPFAQVSSRCPSCSQRAVTAGAWLLLEQQVTFPTTSALHLLNWEYLQFRKAPPIRIESPDNRKTNFPFLLSRQKKVMGEQWKWEYPSHSPLQGPTPSTVATLEVASLPPALTLCVPQTHRASSLDHVCTPSSRRKVPDAQGLQLKA